MNKKYSRFALLSFIAAIVIRSVLILNQNAKALIVPFYLCIVFGMVSLWIDSHSRKEYASAFCYENKFGLSALAFLSAAGLMFDFALNVLSIYSFLISFQYNRYLTIITLTFQCVFALLSVVCFVVLGLSFSKSKGYDVRQLGSFNVVPMVYFMTKGIGALNDMYKGSNIEKMLYYAAIVFGILAFLSYAKEVDSKNGTKPFSTFCFRGFSYVALMCFVLNFVLVLDASLPFVSYQFGYSLSIATVGVMLYFFEKNILAHTKAE